MKYGVRNTLNATATHVKEDDVMSRAQCMPLEPGVVTSVLSKPDLNEGDEVLLSMKAVPAIPVKE